MRTTDERLISKLSQEYVNNYDEYSQKTNELVAKIEMRKQQIVRLENRLNKHGETRPSWIDSILKPIAEELVKHYPGCYYEIAGPFGMNNRTSIWIKHPTKIDEPHYITFIPGNLRDGEILIEDTETDTGYYKKGTLGELNGDNHPHIPIPNDMKIEDLIKWIK